MQREAEKVSLLLYVTTCFTLRTERETGCDIKEKRDLNGEKSAERLSRFKTAEEEKKKLINAIGRDARRFEGSGGSGKGGFKFLRSEIKQK